MDLTESFIQEMIQKLGSRAELDGFEIKRSYDGSVCTYPMDVPLVTVGRDESEKASMLLGADSGSLHSGGIQISVSTDESRGARFCEECAYLVCTAVLEEDENRYITSVRVERAVYEKSCFAYKVMMSFGTREWFCVTGQ